MNEHLKRALGARVQAARKQADLSQEELAGRVGRTPESISNIELGKQLPKIETLAELGRVLDIPIAEFFEAASDQRKISRDRALLEARLRETAKALTDRDLAIAVEQAEAFLKLKSRR